MAAASARLCVETALLGVYTPLATAAASARLCVETKRRLKWDGNDIAAASARLCVETGEMLLPTFIKKQPPPRGCVLKLT